MELLNRDDFFLKPDENELTYIVSKDRKRSYVSISELARMCAMSPTTMQCELEEYFSTRVSNECGKIKDLYDEKIIHTIIPSEFALDVLYKYAFVFDVFERPKNSYACSRNLYRSIAKVGIHNWVCAKAGINPNKTKTPDLKELLDEFERDALKLKDAIFELLEPLPYPIKTHISQIVYNPNPVPVELEKNSPDPSSDLAVADVSINYLNDRVYELECLLKDRDSTIAKLRRSLSDLGRT